MLNRIKYTVTFKSPARTFAQDLTLNPGLTAITGPNGKGKSLILEMLQYALFGSAALRGKADDYELLDVLLEFTIRDTKYLVSRNGSKVLLSTDAGPLATGTKPVNLAIRNLFGYSYDVFQVANAANQGKIEELGNMKPTERRQLIDETVGLSALDKLNEFIQKEIVASGAAVKALEGVLVEPMEPMRPSDYVDPKVVQEHLTCLIINQRTRDVLAALVAAGPGVKMPQLVELEADDNQLEDYKTEQAEWSSLKEQLKLLTTSLVSLPNTPVVEVKLHERDADLELIRLQEQERTSLGQQSVSLKAQINAIAIPSHTPKQLDQEEEDQLQAARWDKAQLLKINTVEHNCPACEHVWDEEDPALKSYSDILGKARPTPAGIAPKVLQLYRNIIAEYPKRLKLEAQLEEVAAKLDRLPDQSALVISIGAARMQYSQAETARHLAVRRADLEVHINVLTEAMASKVERTTDIIRIQKQQTDMGAYQMQLAWHQDGQKKVDAAAAELLTFDPMLDSVIDLNRNTLISALNYDAAATLYVTANTKYQEAMAMLAGYKIALTDWQNGKAAVVELRARIKGFLLPSLNSVASHLINEMTGGELSWIVMNDQFEILVEGQRLETLSGAGKGVANLALRLALGQVLTNRVFSSVVLDEIDGASDDDRAAYTRNCLRALTGTIKQVIQVSHKQGLEADHYVRL